MDISVILVVFGVIFIAELPDKSMFASIALSTHYRKLYVWLGAATAFLVQVIIAVTAGHFLTLLPRRLVETVVATLFLAGAILLFFGKSKDDKGVTKSTDNSSSHNFLKAYSTSFMIVFLGEWGDISQIATANFVAKFHTVLNVAIGATLGLWAVCAFGIIAGTKVLDRIPGRFVQRITAFILLIFAILSALATLKH